MKQNLLLLLVSILALGSCKKNENVKPIIEDPLYAKIPDVNFEKALISLKIDDVQDGKLLRSSAEKVTELYVDGYGKSDNEKNKNLQGIEAFKNLIKLDCSYNQLTSLDVSKNVKLTKLWCYKNQLTSLDISKNVSLNVLYCSNNKLTSLDVSKNTKLTWFGCLNNPLQTICVSSLTQPTTNWQKDAIASYKVCN